jgi:predicted acyltransferase
MTGMPTASPNLRIPAARITALDALRGLAILGMILSGQLPFGPNSLPSWMYHAQVPPPDHVFNPHLPGITWVDLVFPFFLFCLGAAIPLALRRRLESGATGWRVALFALERGFLLGFFALYVQAIRPYVLSNHANAGTYAIALLGFFLLFPILTRLPENWPRNLRWGLKIGGWVAIVLYFASLHYADGSGFSVGRSDIIIIVLANMAFFGTLAWWWTRDHLLLRLGLLGILIAIRLSNMPEAIPGWVSQIWHYSPAPWSYRLYFLQYLFIVLPGTIAGDLIFQSLRERATGDPPPSATVTPFRLVSLAGVCLLLPIVMVIGLKARWLVTTTAIAAGLCGVGWWLCEALRHSNHRVLRQLFGWAVYWLILGLFFEPYEGGIRKDRATVSYYFVTTGLAICVLIAFWIIIEIFQRRTWSRLLVDNGQNPMIAYCGINNLIIPLLALTQADRALNHLDSAPWLGFCKGLIITLLLAGSVSLFTRLRLFWRT